MASFARSGLLSSALSPALSRALSRASVALAAGVVSQGCAVQRTGVRGVTEPMPPPQPAAPQAEAAPLPMPPPPAPKPGPPPADHGGRQTARTLGWITLSVGAEAAVVAVATSIVILNDRSARAAGCDAQKVCTPGAFGANTQMASLSGWNTGSWVLAIAGLGAGTYLVLANPARKRPGAEVGVCAGRSGVAFSLRGSFF